MGKEIRKRRVVVTGLGLITPLGTGVEKTWNALCAGKSGIRRITKFDPSGHACQIAGEVTDFDPADYIEKKEIKKMDTFIHYAVAASQMAVDDAGFKVTPENADRVGVYIGSGIGGLPAIEAFHKVLLEKGPDRVSPFFIPMVIINLASGQVSMRSEEHTSELQSPCNLVCRLLLEKKKKIRKYIMKFKYTTTI